MNRRVLWGACVALVCATAVAGAQKGSRVVFEKPTQRWLWGGFGFHNSETSMTSIMSEEFRDQRVLKTFREISPTYARVFAGYWDWTREAMDRFADYYDATFRRAGTTLYLVPGRMPVITDDFDAESYCEAVATRLEYLVKERKCTKIRYYCLSNELSVGPTYAWFGKHLDLYAELNREMLCAFLSDDFDIITKTYESAAYQEFNNMDMQQFAVKDRPQVSKNNVYNNENDGKMFLSIDLRRANFQALKYVNRKIFNGAQTYEDYVGQFTDLDYLKTSKYTRQVIFGQLNPARHTTVEQYLINKVYKAVLELDYLPFNTSTGLVSMSNDELVFRIDQLYDPKNYSECIVQDIKTKTGLTVHVDAYELHGYSLVSESECTHKEFFVKKDLETGREEFTCMPLQFHMMGWRLFRKQPLHPEDKLFIYENGICRFCEDYKLITIKEAEEKFGKPRDKKKDKNQYKKSKKNEQA